MAGWFPGAGSVGEHEVLVGISDAGTPVPTTIGMIALEARLSWVLSACARDYPKARRSIEVRELKLCPRCGGEARGVVAYVILDEKLVGGAEAALGGCLSCGALN